jgi:hypothetical protein
MFLSMRAMETWDVCQAMFRRWFGDIAAETYNTRLGQFVGGHCLKAVLLDFILTSLAGEVLPDFDKLQACDTLLTAYLHDSPYSAPKGGKPLPGAQLTGWVNSLSRILDIPVMIDTTLAIPFLAVRAAHSQCDPSLP